MIFALHRLLFDPEMIWAPFTAADASHPNLLGFGFLGNIPLVSTDLFISTEVLPLIVYAIPSMLEGLAYF